MTIYASAPIRGYAEALIHYHVWSVGRKQIECYHYTVDDDEAQNLIQRGKAKQLAVPFGCHREQRLGETDKVQCPMCGRDM